jgi:hypothetical protein
MQTGAGRIGRLGCEPWRVSTTRKSNIDNRTFERRAIAREGLYWRLSSSSTSRRRRRRPAYQAAGSASANVVPIEKWS